MKHWHAAAAALLAGTAALVPGAAAQAHGDHDRTFALIGDIPYGDAEIAAFPSVVAQINADPAVRAVVHLGDIKNGSSVCSDEYFSLIKSDFDGFADPLVYTIGDNEWTDCHRVNNGGYNPLERLAKVRQVFFPRPGVTLGQHPMRVPSQAGQGLPENVRWEWAGVQFAAGHVVGSNNSLAPWTGNTTATPEQTVEVLTRTSATLQLFHETFDLARARHSRAVVLAIQADMFDPTVTAPAYSDSYAFEPIVQAIAREAATFGGPVYLLNGDSHVYHSDQPLAAGSSWPAFYHLSAPVPNLTRVTVDGSGNATNYLRVTVHEHGPVLTWEKVPFTG